MTTLTWIGGGNNSASNPKHWSPNGVPLPGDSLIISNKTIDISHSNLAGDVLTVEYPATDTSGTVIDLNHAKISIDGDAATQGGDLTVNASHNDSLNILAPEPQYFGLTVNLSAHAHLLISGSPSFAAFDVNGGRGSEIINNSTLRFFFGDPRITADLQGTGTVVVTRYADAPTTLEVNGAVGSGQTFDLEGGGGIEAGLIIDKPHSFCGTVDIPSYSGVDDVITLVGLHATSFDLKNDMLTLYNGRHTVDTLRVNNQGPASLSVGQSGANIVVDFGGTAPGTLLSQHH